VWGGWGGGGGGGGGGPKGPVHELIVKVIYKVILIEARIRELKEANIASIKRRRAKKSRVRAG